MPAPGRGTRKRHAELTFSTVGKAAMQTASDRSVKKGAFGAGTTGQEGQGTCDRQGSWVIENSRRGTCAQPDLVAPVQSCGTSSKQFRFDMNLAKGGLVVLAVLALVVVPAQAAASVSITVTGGDVTVTLAAKQGVADEDGRALRDVRALTAQITRGGVVARPASALAACRHFCGPSPSLTGFVTARIVDLDGDGEREVLVDRADGFNVCCTSETALLARDAKSGAYSELDVRLGSGYRVVAGPLLRGDDVRFYTRFEPRVLGVHLPVRMWRFRAGRVRDVTRAHPDAVRRDLAQHNLAITANARGPRSDAKRRVLRTALPAWAAGNELLGRHATVTRRLRELVAARRIEASYTRSLRRLLVELGYRRPAQ